MAMPAHQFSTPQAKRPQIVIPCEVCRKCKTKSSGNHPICRECGGQNLQYHYSANADTHPMIALKQNYISSSEAHAEQPQELANLRLPNDGSLVDDSLEASTQVMRRRSLVPTDLVVLHDNNAFMSVHGFLDGAPPMPFRSPREAVPDLGEQALHILNALTFTSDQESLILLARLRLGEAWVNIVEDLHSRQSANDVSLQHGITHNMETTCDESLPSRSHAQEDTLPTALIAPKPWLTELFDRQYFRQVSYIHCNPRSASNAGNPGSQSSFGNMPFSSAIAANYYPAHVQEMQQHNFLVPIWAQRVLNDATIHADPFHHIMNELKNDIASGVTVEDLCGSHPYIAALDDEDTYHRAPKLSQIAARTIASIKSTDASTTFTQYAMMYWFWALWRWLLCPTKETYSGIPEFARPTTSQLFVSHPPVFDFVLPPGLRDMVCQNDTANIQWFTEAAITIQCHWDGSNLSALCRDGLTNEIDFNPICKSHVASLDNWTLGTSVRSFLPEVSTFARIR